MTILKRTGVPNRFGRQRALECSQTQSHLIGRAIICGDWDAAVRELLGPNAASRLNAEARELFTEGKIYRRAIVAYPLQTPLKLACSTLCREGKDARRAFQVLDETSIRFYLAVSAASSTPCSMIASPATRLARSQLATSPSKHENGAVFAIDEPTLADPETWQHASRPSKISPSRPDVGAHACSRHWRVRERGARALEAAGVTLAQLESFDQSSRSPAREGKRRPLRVHHRPQVKAASTSTAHTCAAFELPKGSFATVAMREVMKPTEGAALADEDAEDSTGR